MAPLPTLTAIGANVAEAVMTTGELIPILKAKVSGMIQVLAGMTPKERESLPSTTFVDEYNAIRVLAQKADPATAPYLPPEVGFTEGWTGDQYSESSFAELHAFCSQIDNLFHNK